LDLTLRSSHAVEGKDPAQAATSVSIFPASSMVGSALIEKANEVAR